MKVCLKINKTVKIECNPHITWEANKCRNERGLLDKKELVLNNSSHGIYTIQVVIIAFYLNPNEREKKVYGLVLKLLRAIL